MERHYADALGGSAEGRNYDVTVRRRLATWVITARDKKGPSQDVVVLSQDADGALRVSAHLGIADPQAPRHQLGTRRIGDWVDPNTVWLWIFDQDYERARREWRAEILGKP